MTTNIYAFATLIGWVIFAVIWLQVLRGKISALKQRELELLAARRADRLKMEGMRSQISMLSNEAETQRDAKRRAVQAAKIMRDITIKQDSGFQETRQEFAETRPF